MKNSKGFTIVELITSFALASVVMVFLFTIVMILKDNFISKSVRTDLTIKQALLSKQINEDFKNNSIASVDTCGKKCYEFAFYDGTVKQLTISDAGDVIKYGDYTYELNNSSYAGKMNVFSVYTNVSAAYLNDSILVVDLPIYNKKYPGLNFGVKVIYQFNSILLENNLDAELIDEEEDDDDLIRIISGDGTRLGDEIAIGDEHFYVLTNNGTSIKMIAKYNLNVTLPYDPSKTYKQNTSNIVSPITYSRMPSYIYNYKAYLESLGTTGVSVRSINYSELNRYCSFPSTSSGYCGSIPSFMSNTRYWVDMHIDANTVVVFSNRMLSPADVSSAIAGIRPIVTIPADSI